MSDIPGDVPRYASGGVVFQCWVVGGAREYEWRAEKGMIIVGRKPGSPECWARVNGKSIGTHYHGLRPAMEAAVYEHRKSFALLGG